MDTGASTTVLTARGDLAGIWVAPEGEMMDVAPRLGSCFMPL